MRHFTRTLTVEAMQVTPANVYQIIDWINSYEGQHATVATLGAISSNWYGVKLLDTDGQPIDGGVAVPDCWIVRDVDTDRFEIVWPGPFATLYKEECDEGHRPEELTRRAPTAGPEDAPGTAGDTSADEGGRVSPG